MFLKVTKKEFLHFISVRDFSREFKVARKGSLNWNLGLYRLVGTVNVLAMEAFRFSDGRRNEYYIRAPFPDDDDELTYTEYTLSEVTA